jgi:hypothetical protein
METIDIVKPWELDEIVESHQMDGTVKSSRCKLNFMKSRLRGRANLEE